MTQYIALLRGINVGGKNKIKMADLKLAMENIGLAEVRTYIQSGNALFKSDKDELTLRSEMEAMILSVFGISLIVVLRTAEEFRTIVKGCPFPDELIQEADATCVGECLHVALLPEAPPASGIEKLEMAGIGEDLYHIVSERNVYLLFRKSIRDSKLAVNLPKLGVQATIRNFKTMTKLLEMAEG